MIIEPCVASSWRTPSTYNFLVLTNLDEKAIWRILEFWFGTDPGNIDAIKVLSKKWYSGGEDLDKEVKEYFQEDLEKTVLETTLHWAETPHGALALVILLDQFSRHIYRKTPQAFSQDALARAVTLRAIGNKFDSQLTIPERLFLYHPLHHSERLEDQNSVVDLVAKILEDCADDWIEFVRDSHDFFVSHRETIERFGRFPHRNMVLGRESTEAERQFLEQSSTFGQ